MICCITYSGKFYEEKSNQNLNFGNCLYLRQNNDFFYKIFNFISQFIIFALNSCTYLNYFI